MFHQQQFVVIAQEHEILHYSDFFPTLNARPALQHDAAGDVLCRTADFP